MARGNDPVENRIWRRAGRRAAYDMRLREPGALCQAAASALPVHARELVHISPRIWSTTSSTTFWLGWLLPFFDSAAFVPARPCPDRQSAVPIASLRVLCKFPDPDALPQPHLHLLVQCREKRQLPLFPCESFFMLLSTFRFSSTVLHYRTFASGRKNLS